jgi:flagellin-specific chaperone FliS
LKANIENSTALLDEVSRLMLDVRSGWVAIPQQARARPAG